MIKLIYYYNYLYTLVVAITAIPYGCSIKGGLSSGVSGVADTKGDTVGVLVAAKTSTTIT